MSGRSDDRTAIAIAAVAPLRVYARLHQVWRCNPANGAPVDYRPWYLPFSAIPVDQALVIDDVVIPGYV
ncbi:MAG: hypothetical protein ACUVSY_16095 [Roseiflexus sp.]